MPIAKNVAWIILAVSLSLHGCNKPKSFSIRESIPLGKTTLSVQQTEFDTLRGKNVLVVFIKWTGPHSEKGKFFKPSLARKKYFTILDSSGKRYYFSQIMDEYSWRYLHTLRSTETVHPQQLEYDKLAIGEDYVIVFAVPEGTSNFTLIIKNPFPEGGQAATAEIYLGR